jgi:hypothetical protein
MLLAGGSHGRHGGGIHRFRWLFRRQSEFLR